MEMNNERRPSARTPGMVYGEDQRLGRMFEAHQALRSGTLFPELYKPMKEERMSIDGPRATDEQALAFAAWELRLYLNTHPHDRRALEVLRRVCKALPCPNYASTFLTCDEGWDWVDGPWPWEYENCRRTEDDGHVCV